MSKYKTTVPEIDLVPYSDDKACIALLCRARWPSGFACSACGHQGGWPIEAVLPTYQCRRCQAQTSLTSGTIMHATKLEPSLWLKAASLILASSGRMGAKELQSRLALTSYRTARRLRALIVDAMGRTPYQGLTPERLVIRPMRLTLYPAANGRHVSLGPASGRRSKA